MSVPSFLDHAHSMAPRWEELGLGAPTLIALATLCSQALARGSVETEHLSAEAKAILYAARKRGILEVRGNYQAFESMARFLTVYVELDDERRLRFRVPQNPELTLRFFEGFRQLCSSGLVMHHLYHEFSLTIAGFAFARTIPAADVKSLLEQLEEVGAGH